MKKASALLALPVVVLAGARADAQRRPTPVRLFATAGDVRRGEFGADVAVLGDLDGDGVGDWMVGRTGPPSGAAGPALHVFSGKTGRLLHTLEGLGMINAIFLETLADLGDVDGDGVTDFAYGNANANRDMAINVGAVVVYSGATGEEIYTRWGLRTFGGFGASLAVLGDVDGDGIPDYVAGAIGTLDENAWVVSGATGAIHRRIRGPNGLGDIEFGWSAARLGDVDKDGFPDLAIGTRTGGFVDAYSSGSGARLYRVFGSPSFGRRLAAIEDMNGDGSPDLLVGDPNVRSVHVLSGLDGTILSTLTAPDGVHFGTAVAPAGDVNRDRIPDFLVGDDRFGDRRGRVQLFSGRTHRILFEIVGDRPGDRLGASVAGRADFDSNGWPDFLAGAPGTDSGGLDEGEVTAWSGRRGNPGGHGNGPERRR